MPVRLLFAVVLMNLSLLAVPAAAVEMNNLYDAAVAVADQSDDARANGVQQALQQVLIRISGNPQVNSNPLVKAQLARAGEFVVQFGYSQAAEGQQLALRFDPALVDRLLRQANEPVWGLRRPLVLLWWVDERNGSRQLMGESSAAEQWQQLSAAAARRGLPLMLPVMDLDDSMAVTSADLWGQFMAPVLTASARYQPDLVVVAKSYAAGGSQQLEWWLYPAAAAATAPAQASGSLSFSGLVPLPLVDALADKLAATYGVRASADGGGESLMLTLSELADVRDLAAAQQRLAALNAVSRVELVGLQGKQAHFRLYLLGAAADVERGLDLDRHFQAPAAAAPAAATTSPQAEAGAGIKLISPEQAAAPEAATAQDAKPQAAVAADGGLQRRWVR